MAAHPLNGGPDDLGLEALLAPRDGDDFNPRYECPCGTGEHYFGIDGSARRKHAAWHLDWDRGPTVPSALWVRSSLLVIERGADAKARELAYTLARLFQREQHYDVAMVPHPRIWRNAWDHELPTVLVAVWDERALGCLISYPPERWGLWDGKAGTVEFDHDAPPGAAMVSGIWVANGHRRRGIGAALVAALARRHGVPTSELIWHGPFSDEGEALAKRVSGLPLRIR